MNKMLLPVGFHDVLSPDAKRQRILINDILECFEQHQYTFILPPLIEFKENLSNSHETEKNTFRMIDPFSDEMVAVRSDITTQIARIITSRFQTIHFPIKLCYAGSVVRMKGEGTNASRELVQSGIELVGSKDDHAEVEVIMIILSALKKIGYENIILDFTVPCFFSLLMEEMELRQNEREILLYALDKKDIALLKRISKEKSNDFFKFIEESSNLEKILMFDLPDKVKIMCKKLQETLKIIEKNTSNNYPNCLISLDLLEASKFNYHTDIGFSIFIKGINGEVARGGNYEITQEKNNKKITATGATLYINQLNQPALS